MLFLSGGDRELPQHGTQIVLLFHNKIIPGMGKLINQVLEF